MKYPAFLRPAFCFGLAALLLASFSSPSSAFFWNKKGSESLSSPQVKNVMAGLSISFSAQDFAFGDGSDSLTAITINTLPDASVGSLFMGDQPISSGAVVDLSALTGLRFQASPAPAAQQTQFSYTPVFSSGTGEEVVFTLVVLSQPNQAPIAKNMELSTYKNVELTGWFDAVDSEGDVLTFQLTSTPARGAVTVAEDGSSQFVYTPYEDKTGKDSFTYVAIDPAGNTSPEAKVTIRISKPDTKVTYADMQGHPAHKASIRLAEAGVYVGANCNGAYFFQPDQAVSRGEFLTMAMSVSGLEPLEGVTMTGFYDDDAIPTWCKGYVSSALKAGVVRGSAGESGQCVFHAQNSITMGEATVMLNNLLNISDVSVETFGSLSDGHWANQAAVNLATAGVLRGDDITPQSMSAQLTRSDVAMLLDGALDVLEQREASGWFGL